MKLRATPGSSSCRTHANATSLRLPDLYLTAVLVHHEGTPSEEVDAATTSRAFGMCASTTLRKLKASW